MILEDALWTIASLEQEKVLDAIRDTGSYRAAARSLGVAHDAPRQTVTRLRSRLKASGLDEFEAKAIRDATRGWAPDFELEHPLPPGFSAKGYSTYRNLETGQATRRWEKSEVDKELRHQAILAGIRAECRNVPRLKLLAPPKLVNQQLLNLFVFTDYHLGMRAWSEEGGADWNLEIAEQLIIQAFQRMMATAPTAAVAFIGQLGDFMHFDGLRPVTPTSGHIVDAAANYQQIVRACIRILRALVDLALQRHDKVVILAAEGNHDLGSSAWMRELLAVLYENDPRVEVVNSGHPFYAYEWGLTMLGFHHGHGAKKESWPLKFASHYSEMWGRTKKRYAHGGHYHHEVSKGEADGMRICQWPTLAPSDRHSALGGYHSERQTSVISFDKRFGQIAENIVTPEMLEAA